MEKMKQYKERLETLNLLIRLGDTGAPHELARKLDISERRIYSYINYLKDELNAPIVYNYRKRSYEYSHGGSLQIRWASDSARREMKVSRSLQESVRQVTEENRKLKMLFKRVFGTDYVENQHDISTNKLPQAT